MPRTLSLRATKTLAADGAEAFAVAFAAEAGALGVVRRAGVGVLMGGFMTLLRLKASAKRKNPKFINARRIQTNSRRLEQL